MAGPPSFLPLHRHAQPFLREEEKYLAHMSQAGEPQPNILERQAHEPKKVISPNAGSILANPEPALLLRPGDVTRIRTAFTAKEASGQLSKQQVRDVIQELQLIKISEESLLARILVARGGSTLSGGEDIRITCEEFLEHYPKVMAPSTQFGERLRRACARGEEGMIRDLISRGTNPNLGDGMGDNCVHYASQFGQIGVLHLLKELCGDSLLLDAKDKSGWTPLTTAIIHNQPQAALALIKLGVKLNATNNEGRTALHWACSKGREELVELLVSHGADLNIKDRTGWTPLHYASINENATIIKTLIRGGADVSLCDILDHRAEHYVGQDAWTRINRDLSESRKSSSSRHSGGSTSVPSSYPKDLLNSGYSTVSSTTA